MPILVGVSIFNFSPSFLYSYTCRNSHHSCLFKDGGGQTKVRATVACKKEEEKQAKLKEGTSSLVPKIVKKGSAKRKPDEKDDHPSKKVVVAPRDASKKKSPLKPSHGAGKGLMTSTSFIAEGSRRLLTHKEYAVETVGSIIRPTDVEPCAEQGTEKLGASALFDLS